MQVTPDSNSTYYRIDIVKGRLNVKSNSKAAKINESNPVLKTAMSKVIPLYKEGVNWTEKPSKSAVIKQKWHDFVENSTLHGMHCIISSQTTFRRIVWILFLLVGVGYFSYQTSVLLKKYLSFPVTTKTTLEFEKEPEFPAVTICNFNILRKSTVQKHNFTEVTDLALMSKAGVEVNDTNIDWSRYEDVDVYKIYLEAGHQIQDMILDCSWKGERCSYQNFTPILTSMGLCHTFNSGKDGRQILKVSHAGAKFGLNLKLNIEQIDYFGSWTSQAGLKVLIHHQETPPRVEELGFSLAPGTSTLAAIRKEKVYNLRHPYETNCTDHAIEHLPGYTKYTTSACMLSCHSKFLIEQCGCRDVKILSETNTEVCGIHKMATCLFSENEQFYKVVGERCKCPVPCEITSFKADLSYASFPSDIFLKELIRVNVENATEEEIKDFISMATGNFLELNVYFHDLNMFVLEQQPAYSKESLLGEIGGQLGLCIGASLLTLLEFCDVIFTILKIRFGRAG